LFATNWPWYFVSNVDESALIISKMTRRDHQIMIIVLCAFLSQKSLGQHDNSSLIETANDLFVQARQYEANKQFYISLRTFQAAYRLLPTDKRFIREAKRLASYCRGKVYLNLEVGRRLVLPVLYPPGTAEAKPAQPGSADDLVASFFRQHSIPIFRNDSPKCAIHTAGSKVCPLAPLQAFADLQSDHLSSQDGGGIFTVMGHTCLSRAYADAHNQASAQANLEKK
jgi:hypothetical protein